MDIVVENPREIFPIKIINSRDRNFTEYKDDLISWMENYIEHNKSASKSNVGGYQSRSNFHVDENGEIIESFYLFHERIKHHIGKTTEIYCMGMEINQINFSNMWFNFNYKNCYNNIHVHPKASISGVLWVQTIEEHPPITFHDPNDYAKTSMGIKTSEAFYPKDGDMLLFPSYLHHGVNINTTDVTRISIAFNLQGDITNYD